MIGGFSKIFPNHSQVVAVLAQGRPKKSVMAIVSGFRWSFPQTDRESSLALATSRSEKSVMAIIGDFPNQTSANQTRKTIEKQVIEL